MAPFVGVVETICGALIIGGLLTRLAAVPLIIIMPVALVSTKLPMWLGHDVPRAGKFSIARNSDLHPRACRDHPGGIISNWQRSGFLIRRLHSGAE